MERELNRSLFGTQGLQNPAAAPAIAPRSAELDSSDKQILAIQIENLKKKVKELEGKQSTTDGRLEALAKATKLKVDQSTSRLDRIEAYLKSAVQDLASKFAGLSGRVTNSKLNEDKIDALLTRHNQVVQNFESRMSQLQKIISEQELNILNHKSALEEAKAQFQRLMPTRK